MGLIKSIIKKPFEILDDITGSSKRDKPGLFDVFGRVDMSKAILSLKGKCPKCGGELGVTKCKKCGLDIQDWAWKQAKEIKKSIEEVNIPNASIKKFVHFLGGHKSVPNPVEGWLGLTNKAVVFKNAIGDSFEITFKTIKNIDIVDDKYTPSLTRGLVVLALGGDGSQFSSQSYRPHKSVLKITFEGKTRTKDLEFNFNALTWAGAVEECQQFYSQLNSMLD